MFDHTKSDFKLIKVCFKLFGKKAHLAEEIGTGLAKHKY